MITTSEYVQKMECPICKKKKLRIWASNGGEGNSQLILNCTYCNTSITTNLIPNTNDWIILEKASEKEKRLRSKKIWNQA